MHFYVSSSTPDLSAFYILHILFSSFSRWTGSWFITGDSTGEKSPSQNTPLLVSHVDHACVESSCPAVSQRVPVASKNDSTCLEMNGRDRCPLHPWYCLSQFTPVSSGLDCYSYTWNLGIQGGMLPGCGGLEWWGWFRLLSRWQHEIRDVTGAGPTEVRLERGSCSVILAV